MPAIAFSFDIYALLFATGLFAGFVDAIAGGGGLISLPVLLSVGLPPQLALGTNKLQGSFGALSAALNYMRNDPAPFRKLLPGVAFTLVGAMLGAWAIQRLDAAFLGHIIPVLLFIVLVYTFFSRRLGYAARRAVMPEFAFYACFGLALGFYDGFFGPGTGSFWTAALLVFLGLPMTSAVGYTKVMNFTSNIVALGIFLIHGNVLFAVGLCMAAGQVLGARLGSTMAIRKGAGFIRPVFMVVVFATLVRVVYVTYLR